MQNIKNIIFDLGGVLLNVDYHKTTFAFQELGVGNFDDLFSQFRSNALFEKLETGNISDESFYEEIKKYSKGIMEMRLRLYFTEFSKIFLPYPPFEEQQVIVTYLDEQTKKIDDLKAKYRQETDLIKEYKERLIYDVVTGKINLTQEASHVRL